MKLKKIFQSSTILACISTASIALSPVAFSQERLFNENSPVLLEADDVAHDQALDIITANGNVELVQDGRVILAETLSYNQRSDTVTASGNVRLIEANGEVLFAEYMELTQSLTKGILKQIRVLLQDNVRIAANGAKRFNEKRTELVKAVYSPCALCKDDPEKNPLWQIKANKIVHNKEERIIEYYDSWLEMFGYPVAYSPYLRHPDPSVNRDSGFLAPSFGSNNSAGTYIQIPYFWVLSDDKDITLKPAITTESGPLFNAEYRQAFRAGKFEIEGSFLYDQNYYENNVQNDGHSRWHIDSYGEYQISDNWRLDFDINRQSDRLYLDQYELWENPGNTLESKIALQGFNNRNYVVAEAFNWQELRANPDAKQSVVFPNIAYHGLGEGDSFGGRWSLDGDFRYLKQGANSKSLRFSSKAGYEINTTTDFGVEFKNSISIQADLYDSEHLDDSQLSEDLQSRITPRISSLMRMPLARDLESGTQVIEPIVGLFATPRGGYDQDIRNNDSLIVEQDEVTLFQSDMTPGLDRIETGTRVAYGIKSGHYFADGAYIEGTVAQSYRFFEDQTLFQETGIDHGASDYFGSVAIRPTDYFDLAYRFRADYDDLDLIRNEVQLNLGTNAAKLSARYTNVEEDAGPSTERIEEGYISASMQWDDYWRVNTHWLHDIDESDTREAGASVSYEDECLIFKTSYNRDFTTDGIDGPSNSIIFKITFKTLGDVNQNVAAP